MRKLFVVLFCALLGALAVPAEARQSLDASIITQEVESEDHEGLDTFIEVTYHMDALMNGSLVPPFTSAPPSDDVDLPTLLPASAPVVTQVRIMSVSAAEFIRKHPDVTLKASMDLQPWQPVRQLPDGSWIIPIKSAHRTPGPVSLQLQLQARTGYEAKKLKLLGIIPTRWIPWLGKKLNPRKPLYSRLGQVLRFEAIPCRERSLEGISLWMVRERNFLAHKTTGMRFYFELSPEMRAALDEEYNYWNTPTLPMEEELPENAPVAPGVSLSVTPEGAADPLSEVLPITYYPGYFGGYPKVPLENVVLTVFFSDGQQKSMKRSRMGVADPFSVGQLKPGTNEKLEAWGTLTATANGQPVTIPFDTRTKQGGVK